MTLKFGIKELLQDFGLHRDVKNLRAINVSRFDQHVILKLGKLSTQGGVTVYQKLLTTLHVKVLECDPLKIWTRFLLERCQEFENTPSVWSERPEDVSHGGQRYCPSLLYHQGGFNGRLVRVGVEGGTIEPQPIKHFAFLFVPEERCVDVINRGDHVNMFYCGQLSQNLLTLFVSQIGSVYVVDKDEDLVVLTVTDVVQLILC